MLKIDIATLFPEMCEAVLSASIIGRARKAGYLDIACFHIRDYTADKHRNVDDTPYGPGKGMLMQADPMYRTWEAACARRGGRPHVIYMTPQGKTLTQERAKELSQMEHLYIMCGHYEGVDQRVIDEIVDEEISIGDYVLTGGELGALVLADCVGRLCPGVLADESCFTEESHWDGLLEYPQYTKPAVWHGAAVPEIITNGNHAAIARWRREMSLKTTFEKRPELLEKAALNEKDKWYLRTIGWTEQTEKEP
ncbi:MAG: tRNA (guanosine(37)-N1)-methyltransferase TrmD [Ruminococcaceae bacterium]|nr:tRNA (guanosine(37)-N1)-methyltransferase TrmD [Oscillospiraceae bacterium]